MDEVATLLAHRLPGLAGALRTSFGALDELSRDPAMDGAMRKFTDLADFADVVLRKLTPAQVRLALTYRQAYPEELEQAVADNRRPLDELRALFPFIEVAEA